MNTAYLAIIASLRIRATVPSGWKATVASPVEIRMRHLCMCDTENRKTHCTTLDIICMVCLRSQCHIVTREVNGIYRTLQEKLILDESKENLNLAESM